MTLFPVYIHCSEDQSAAVLRDNSPLISTLASAQDVNVFTVERPPHGCAVSTVSATCEVHMMLKVRSLLNLRYDWL